jgi:hypothetical protein
MKIFDERFISEQNIFNFEFVKGLRTSLKNEKNRMKDNQALIWS